ncbi:F-box domain containing protein [Pandoravirus quercus]|uniref:F-box domain containing protein n=1 Tax=Pandoravirus quercus TaxID=2107709 RepID=A0A2U7U9R2_9VIRU|nr:F-box domain containing protein [Pandoravirus quercus]AVK75181.1 F-box domain containing protein [Pandoravirus quercus]
MDINMNDASSHMMPTAIGLDALADELLVEILVRLLHANDIGRCALLSRRFADLIAHDPDGYVWRRAVEYRARLVQLDGPWLAFAASTQGWAWVRRSLDPWRGGTHNALGTVRERSSIHLGAYREDGKHGDLISILPGRDWRFAGPVDDAGVSLVSSFDIVHGDTYRGQSHNQKRHGWGTFTRAPRGGIASAVHIEGEWRHGRRHGIMTIHFNCACPTCPLTADGDAKPGAAAPCIVGNPSPDSQGQPALGVHGTDPTRPYGYVAQETRRYGALCGPYRRLYCNGDLYECGYDQDGETVGSMRLVLSPHCPDPRFRLVEITGDVRRKRIQRSGDERGLLVLTYPDPVTSPDMFCIYRDYFEAGFLPVEERDRATITAILAEAALDLDG